MVFKIITIVLLILILNQHEFDLWAPFNKINIDPITTVLAQLGVKAQAQANIKLPERMHLKPAEEQHIKTITDMSAEKSQELHRQAGLIAVLQHINAALNLNLDPYIGFFTEQAAQNWSKSVPMVIL